MFIHFLALVKVKMRRRKIHSQPWFVIFFLCSCSFLRCSSGSAASGSNVSGSFAEMALNVIGVISRIRNGSSATEAGEEEARSVLDDPRFLYKTFYRDEDKGDEASDEETERSAPYTVTSDFHSDSPFLRMWDILEIEYNLHRLRQDARLPVSDDQEAINESTKAASPADAPSASVSGEETMGGVSGRGCNMADHPDGSSPEKSGESANSRCSSSIQRPRRQVAEDLEPYVPYLGFIFYSFPVFSFTLPFGGQLKLFGYDFI